MRIIIRRTGKKAEERFSHQRITASLRTAGQTVIEYLKRFWNRKDAAEPNQWFNAGSTRTHFWKKISNSVDSKPIVRNKGVIIRVRDTRIRQKIHGGPIVPVKAKALTIPNHPDAHGRTAKQLEFFTGVKLFILQTKWGAFLAGKNGRSVVKYYVLKRSVNQPPWPRSIPEERLMRRTFMESVRSYFKGLKNE